MVWGTNSKEGVIPVVIYSCQNPVKLYFVFCYLIVSFPMEFLPS